MRLVPTVCSFLFGNPDFKFSFTSPNSTTLSSTLYDNVIKLISKDMNNKQAPKMITNVEDLNVNEPANSTTMLNRSNSDCCSASDSSGDSTSTYRYSHEPWDSFQNKALRLAVQLFPNVRTEDIQLERMRGGSSNRVVGIDVPERKPQGLLALLKRVFDKVLVMIGFESRLRPLTTSRYIIRIPRWGSELVQRNIATLKYASSNIRVPAPTVVSYDSSDQNALGAPYVLQHRLTGQSLQAVFTNLNLEQRKDLTRKVSRLILEIQDLFNGNCATITSYNEKTSQYKMETLSVPPDPTNNHSSHSLLEHTPMDTLTFITTTCQRWKDHESTYLEHSNAEWDQCSNIAREMHSRGFLNATDQFHFAHMDLYPRNILVEVIDDSSIKITGVLDWDDALFVPKFVACRAPFWLWEGKETMDECDEYEALKEPQDPGMKEIKLLFESLVGNEFLIYAYREEYILLRRMFTILRLGLGYSHHFKEIEDILARWQEMSLGFDAEQFRSDR
jgi:hypothetical protein